MQDKNTLKMIQEKIVDANYLPILLSFIKPKSTAPNVLNSSIELLSLMFAYENRRNSWKFEEILESKIAGPFFSFLREWFALAALAIPWQLKLWEEIEKENLTFGYLKDEELWEN